MLTISPENALQLPVNEIALLALADLVATSGGNQYNYVNRHCQDDWCIAVMREGLVSERDSNPHCSDLRLLLLSHA